MCVGELGKELTQWSRELEYTCHVGQRFVVVAKWQPLLHLGEMGLANLLCFRRVMQGSEFMVHWESTSVYRIQKGKLETQLETEFRFFFIFVKTHDNYSLILNRRSLNSQGKVSYSWMSPCQVSVSLCGSIPTQLSSCQRSRRPILTHLSGDDSSSSTQTFQS